MHLLPTGLLLVCAIAPSLILAAPEPLNAPPKPSPSSGTPNTVNPPTPASNNTKPAITTAVAAPAPSSSFWPLEDPALAPAHDHKNCKGSGMCGVTGPACKYAASLYEDDLLYVAKTSYIWMSGNFWKDSQNCAAIFVCDNDAAYKQGLTGKQIKAMAGILYSSDTKTYGKQCKRCGSEYSKVGCHLTLNFCRDCEASGQENALPAPGAPPHVLSPGEIYIQTEHPNLVFNDITKQNVTVGKDITKMNVTVGAAAAAA